MKKKTFYKNPHNNRNRGSSHYKKTLYMQHSSEPKKSGSAEPAIEQQIDICGAVLGKQLANYASQGIIKNANVQKAITKNLIETRFLGMFCLIFGGCSVSMVLAKGFVDSVESFTYKDQVNIVGGTGLTVLFACLVLWGIKNYMDNRDIRKCDKEIAEQQEDIRKNNADIKRLQQMLNDQYVRYNIK